MPNEGLYMYYKADIYLTRTPRHWHVVVKCMMEQAIH